MSRVNAVKDFPALRWQESASGGRDIHVIWAPNRHHPVRIRIERHMISQRLLVHTCRCPIQGPRKDRVPLLVAEALHEDLAQEIRIVHAHAAG